MARSPGSLTGVLTGVARTAARLCEARDCLIFLLSGEQLSLAAKHGSLRTARRPGQSIPLDRNTVHGQAVIDRRAIQVRDLVKTLAGRQQATGIRTILAAPLMRDGLPVGVISICRTVVRPFTPRQISLLKIFADQAVIAIENVRLFTELQSRNRELTTAQERETATSEILRVISRSPTDTEPVFSTILESACRLCEANIATLFLFDGEYLSSVAHHNASPAFAEHLRRSRLRPSRETSTRLAALERRVVHIHDLLTDSAFAPSEVHRQENVRSVLSVPLLRDTDLVGVLTVWRREVRPFTGRHITLLETFAHQAVIAIANVRLFTELQARNRALSEALEQQTATSEILHVISGSPTDVQPVFAAVAASAARLCEAFDAAIFQVDGHTLRMTAHEGPIPAHPAGEGPPLARGTPPGRAVLERRTIHVADMQTEIDEYPEGTEIARRFGHHTVLVVPCSARARHWESSPSGAPRYARSPTARSNC